MGDKYNQIKQTWKIKSILNEAANNWKQSYGCYPTIKEFINLINENAIALIDVSNTLIENRLITSNDITWLSKTIINEQNAQRVPATAPAPTLRLTPLLKEIPPTYPHPNLSPPTPTITPNMRGVADNLNTLSNLIQLGYYVGKWAWDANMGWMDSPTYGNQELEAEEAAGNIVDLTLTPEERKNILKSDPEWPEIKKLYAPPKAPTAPPPKIDPNEDPRTVPPEIRPRPRTPANPPPQRNPGEEPITKPIAPPTPPFLPFIEPPKPKVKPIAPPQPIPQPIAPPQPIPQPQPQRKEKEKNKKKQTDKTEPKQTPQPKQEPEPPKENRPAEPETGDPDRKPLRQYQDSNGNSSPIFIDGGNATTERIGAKIARGDRYYDNQNRVNYTDFIQVVNESHSGTLNTKHAIQNRSKKQQYKIVALQDGKKLEIFAKSIQGIRRAVFGKKNFRVYDGKGADITNYFKRLMAGKKST